MAFITTVRPANAKQDVQTMYRRQQQACGFVPNYAKAFSLRPEVMASWTKLLATVKALLPYERFLLVNFATATALNHSPCTLAYGSRLAKLMAIERLLAVARGDTTGLNRLDKAIVVFAQQIARDASGVQPRHIAALRQSGLSDREIFDIAAVAASRCFFSKLLDSLGTAPDSSCQALDERLRAIVRNGRAIDDRPPEILPDCASARLGGSDTETNN